eukprot:6190295-Pleurochrysis_carterae.AAC.1
MTADEQHLARSYRWLCVHRAYHPLSFDLLLRLQACVAGGGLGSSSLLADYECVRVWVADS